ncbi:hypothetical protein C7999DRAFT_27004 [Corynascus novoguineensis]|uniref:Uncharacterized protein n=1 Tax=Corynascus novoguineensis TaxID=1126955 RepID=A0AAN7D267_9PEZI|nr:hypothetical protein C7999DRAFT_27004 [Corynascus novoguineensis]
MPASERGVVLLVSMFLHFGEAFFVTLLVGTLKESPKGWYPAGSDPREGDLILESEKRAGMEGDQEAWNVFQGSERIADRSQMSPHRSVG